MNIALTKAIVVTCCLILLADVSAGSLDMPEATHDQYRLIAADGAENSHYRMEQSYQKLILRLRQSGLVGEQEHDAWTLELLQNSQKRWLVYRDEHCDLMAMIEVFPRDSRMFSSAYYSCLSDENRKRLAFIEELSIRLDSSERLVIEE